MAKRLLLCCAFVMMYFVGVSARTAAQTWYMIGDDHACVSVSDVAYLLFEDGAEKFSIVKNDGAIIPNIAEVYFSETIPESVDELEAERLAVSVFPNPVVSQLTLQGLKEAAQVRVLSLDGALLIDTTVAPQDASVNVASLPAGVYMLQVNATTVKFIKK